MNTPEEVKMILERELESEERFHSNLCEQAKKNLDDFHSNPNLYTILWNLHTQNICIDCGGLDINELLRQINEEHPTEHRIEIKKYLIANIKC